MIVLNGQTLPSPKEMDVSWQEVTGTRQVNALGNIVRDVLGVKRRVRLHYAHIRDEAAKQLAQAIDPMNNMTLTYPDMEGEVTITVMCRSLQSSLYHKDAQGCVWADVDVILEEV